jgi:uncharacterized protein YaeQ
VALKPTIFKANITLADVDRNVYDTLNLTLAQHPSESVERMMARVIAFCMNATEALTMTRGLSTVEEPDIWEKTLDGRIALWVEVGEPSFDRIKKAGRLSSAVRVYSFNLKSDSWWEKEGGKFQGLSAEVFQLQWKGIQKLAGLTNRTMDLSVTVSDGVVYVSGDTGECEISWKPLKAN